MLDPTPRISDGISKGSISRFENSELSISRFENSLVIIIFLKYDAHAALRLINLRVSMGETQALVFFEALLSDYNTEPSRRTTASNKILPWF